MITTIDEDAGVVTVSAEGIESRYSLASAEGFAAASKAWLRAGWDAKHVYSFTWLGRPIIQLPEDMVRMQEVIYTLKPDVIVETGVAHGGSLVFYASLLSLIGKGRVIGIDLTIRPHNRAAIEAHELSHLITLVEGDAVSKDTAKLVSSLVRDGEKVLVLLDSNHSHQHVLDELRIYGKLVSRDSYIVATDGIMQQVRGAPRTQSDWDWNNPRQAVTDFLRGNMDFVLEEPEWLFNEGAVTARVTYWPDAFLRRVR
jgi:cephalosporin hydroxylase